MKKSKVKIEVEKFDGKGDFGMWKFKMQMQLENADLDSVLNEEDTSSTSETDKDAEKETKPGTGGLTRKEMDKRAKNMICASLGNLVLRKVMKQTTALGVWKALEKDYQTKTLPNRIYLKQRFTSFKMEEHRSVEENMDVFLRLVDDLESLNITISDEDQAIQVLSSLPKQFDTLVHTLKYGNGKETLTLQEVTTSAYAKEVELKEAGLIGKARSNAEGLIAERGRSESKSQGNGKVDLKAETTDRSQDQEVQVNPENAGHAAKRVNTRKIVQTRRTGNQMKLLMLLMIKSNL